MNLFFDREKSRGYRSPSQIARILTEDWATRNLFCPACTNPNLQTARDNTKVIDFICQNCSEAYQLKSQRKPLGGKILDSAYEPMIDSIKKNSAPNLFLLHYSPADYSAENLLIIPRYFLTLSCIEARKPLSISARRAGWRGCNIILHEIPSDGKIPIIQERKVMNPETVRLGFDKFRFLSREKHNVRGWTADVLKCVRKLDKRDFSLSDVYNFQKYLEILHPGNKHVRHKIRQQLQVLRDKGILRFRGNGQYTIE